ncbi:MAG: hypothetical protein AAFP77_23420 [Bacteroidota bacterium]
MSSALPIGSTIVMQGDNTRFITIASESMLSVNENSQSNAERFRVIDAGDGQIALQASSGKYVTIDHSRHGRIQATASTMGVNERFTVANLPAGGFSVAAYASGGVLLATGAEAKKFMYQEL